jgi:N6-adenosine-specific RNA methylase IME4
MMTLTPESLLKSYKNIGTILADPPWQFSNRTGKMAPEHRRLHRYHTMKIGEICALPVPKIAADKSHLYLWCPNALISWGLQVMKAWGFEYKTNIVWLKVRKDGGPDGRGVGFYYRNVTELVLFGTRGKLRTLQPGRRMVNFIATMKEGHSKKPKELYDMIEQCSAGPFLELFARGVRPGWMQWGDEFPKEKSNGSEKQKVSPRPMENGMIRPYRMPQLSLQFQTVELTDYPATPPKLRSRSVAI